MNLVAQGPGMSAGEAAELARLTGAGALEPLGARAFRLRGAARDDALAAWCAARRIDHAWVPEGRRFADLRLLALDMDSTLITIECVDEIAAAAGKKAEVAALTAQAMRGEIAYPESLRRRVALLAGLDESVLQEVYDEKLGLSPGAERLLARCRSAGVRTLLVSGGFSFFTERLKERLELDDTLSNLLDIENGRLTGRVLGPIVDAAEKAAKFSSLRRRLGAKREQTLAIGDGANDLAMMAEAGWSVAYRAKPVVRARADCALDYCGLDAVLNFFE